MAGYWSEGGIWVEEPALSPEELELIEVALRFYLQSTRREEHLLARLWGVLDKVQGMLRTAEEPRGVA